CDSQFDPLGPAGRPRGGCQCRCVPVQRCGILDHRPDLDRRRRPDARLKIRAGTEEAMSMVSGRVRLSVAEARELAERALRGLDYSSEDARIIADHCMDAALCGYEYSGLA